LHKPYLWMMWQTMQLLAPWMAWLVVAATLAIVAMTSPLNPPLNLYTEVMYGTLFLKLVAWTLVEEMMLLSR
jgi:hypothetical protein